MRSLRLDKNLHVKIRYEIAQIDKLLNNAAVLFNVLASRDPDFIELTASGSLLHSFYNGIENIFIMIEKHYGENINESASRHKELLKNARISTKNRKKVISDKTAERLSQYLMFRHFFRHAYGFQMDWKKMKHLVDDIETLW